MECRKLWLARVHQRPASTIVVCTLTSSSSLQLPWQFLLSMAHYSPPHIASSMPQLVGYYDTATAAARDRDRAGIGFQSNPRLNLPYEVHTRQQIWDVVLPIITNARDNLAPDIRNTIEKNIQRYERCVTQEQNT
jgi:hypothetical protein